ncbi:MAG: DNA-binding protein [Methylobacterium radiotolerans]
MKLWLTAAEIAALALPGLPGTKRNVNAMAETLGWADRRGLCRKRKHSGGGLEYHLDLLPPDARRAYVSRLVAEPVPADTMAAAEAEPTAAALRDDAAEARDARLAILAAAEKIFTEAKLPRLHCDLLCVADYRAGRLVLPEWVREQIPSLTLRSLQRWRAAQRAGATVRLAVDRGAARRGSGILDTAEDGQVRVYALALIAKQPHLSADHVRESWSRSCRALGSSRTSTSTNSIASTSPSPWRRSSASRSRTQRLRPGSRPATSRHWCATAS